jgi:hypothetical protein
MKTITSGLIIILIVFVGVYLYKTRSSPTYPAIISKCETTERVYVNYALGYQITLPPNWSAEAGQNRDRFVYCDKSIKENDFQIVGGTLYTEGRKKIKDMSIIPGAVVSEWYSTEEDNPGYKYSITFQNGKSFSLYPIYPHLTIERYPFVSSFKLIE